MSRARDGDHVGKKEQLEIAYRRKITYDTLAITVPK